MKRYCAFFLAMFIMLTACGQHTPTWQEQYDLGIRYLSEGNYEEAIIAFTAAIEINPKQAPAYVGRGDAYVCLGETEENLTAAQADYERAIELDETLVEAYLGLAQIYEKTGNYPALLALLRQGIENTPSIQLTEMLDRYQNDSFYNSDAFLPLSSVDEEAGNILLESLQILHNGDMDGLGWMLLNHKDHFEKLVVLYPASLDIIRGELRTTIDGLKVQVYFYYSPSSARTNTGEPIAQTRISLEIRPLTGTGYFYEIDKDEYQYSGRTSQTIRYTKGECKNWNWNGTFEHTKIDSDNGTVRSVGTVVDGLLDGEVYCEEINPQPEIEKVVSYYAFSGGKHILTRDKKFENSWKMGDRIVTYADGKKHQYDISTNDPDGWNNWCSNYQTGAHLSSPIPERERLWN